MGVILCMAMYLYPTFAKVTASPLVILFFSGAFLALSQLAPMLWWGIVPGFILFVLGIWQSLSWRKVAVGGLMVGTLKAMGGFAWIWHAYPLVWLDINSGITIFVNRVVLAHNSHLHGSRHSAASHCHLLSTL